METLIFDIGLVVIFASLCGMILYILKQPLILAYILAGILIGPFGFKFIENPEFVQNISMLGIMLMLFLVGLEMNTSRLKDLGAISLVAGLGQVIFTSIVGFILISLFKFDFIQAIYLTIALTFSSTVIAVKTMSDKNDLQSLYGQICVGILFIQDSLAIISLIILAGFRIGSFSFDYIHFASIFGQGLILTILCLLISKYILKNIYKKIATSRELLILFSLGWCFFISLFSIYIGFSMQIGAFIAGISLSNLPYTFEINSKTKVLRDFFITIFFAALGAGLIFSSIGHLLIPCIVLALFVLIGNPIIVMIIMGIMGYDKKISFFTGLTIANISEFSLMVVALGYALGHLDDTIVSMVAIIGMFTMTASSYMITYNMQLYKFFKKYLGIFEKKQKKEQYKLKKKFSNHIILIGCGYMGSQILSQILSFKDDYIVVENDNHIIKRLIKSKVNCVFGDITDEEIVEELNIQDAELIISTVPNIDDNYILLKMLNKIDVTKRPILIIVANSAREGLDAFNKGVDYVVLKPYLGADHVHYINKEIYQIDKDLHHTHVPKDIKHPSHASEHDIAKLLHNLNRLRLKEIKDKINKNKNIFKTKLI